MKLLMRWRPGFGGSNSEGCCGVVRLGWMGSRTLICFLRGETCNMGQRTLLCLVHVIRARLSDWKFDRRGVV